MDNHSSRPSPPGDPGRYPAWIAYKTLHSSNANQMSVARAATIAEKGMTFDIVRQSALFPTMEILNSFFQCGIDDTDSGCPIQWEPFTLTPAGYEDFVEHCRMSMGALKIDGLGFDNYSDWFSVVAVRSTDS